MPYKDFTALYKYFTFGSHICSFTSVTSLICLVWQTYVFFLISTNSFEIMHTCIYIVLLPTDNYMTVTSILICQPYFFFHIYDHLHIPCLKRHISRNYILYACIYVHAFRRLINTHINIDAYPHTTACMHMYVDK